MSRDPPCWVGDMAIREIEITPSRDFSFQVEFDSQVVTLSFRWNLTGQYWTFGLKGDTLTDEVIGAAVVTGVNLLRPYAIRELGELWCVDGKDLGEDPDFDNFGARWSMLYIEKGTVL